MIQFDSIFFFVDRVINTDSYLIYEKLILGASQSQEWMNGMFGIRENLIFLDVNHSIALRIGRNPLLFSYEQLRMVVQIFASHTSARLRLSFQLICHLRDFIWKLVSISDAMRDAVRYMN